MESVYTAMTVETVTKLLEGAGGDVSARSGRSDSYGAPRDFTFEVRCAFPNGLSLQIIARQFNYRDPWEGAGRVNDMVDVSLLRNGAYSQLPKGCGFFQGRDCEENIDWNQLVNLVETVAKVNPKLFQLQELTGTL